MEKFQFKSNSCLLPESLPLTWTMSLRTCLGFAAVRAAGARPGQDTWLKEDTKQEAWVQFEAELTKTGCEMEIPIFEQT